VGTSYTDDKWNKLTVTDCTFTNVEAQNGGVLYATDQCDVTLTDNQFQTISASQAGGVFYFQSSDTGEGDSLFSSDGDYFNNCQSGTTGGVLYLANSILEV